MADNAFVYNLEFSDPLKDGIVILPGTTDSTTSLNLSGNGNLKWGEDFNESLLHIMEHFSNDTAPSNPVAGQIWFDSAIQDLYLYAGSPLSWIALGIGPGAITSQFVRLVGDTMTGNLEIEKSSPRLNLNTTDATDIHISFLESDVEEARVGYNATSNSLSLQLIQSGSPAVSETFTLASGQGEIDVPLKLLAGDPVAPEDATRKQYVDDAITAGTSAAVPSGTISMFAGGSAPSGYFICDAAAISRTTYAALFAVVGTTYGNGDGSTTFNLPDMRGRFPVGVRGAATGGSRVASHSTVLGINSGTEFHTLAEPELPSHTHTYSMGSNGSHTHSGSTNTSGSHTHTFKAAYKIGGYTDNGGAPDERSTTQTRTTNSGGSHSHTMSLNSNGSHTHTLTINNTGSGTAHENTPPYLAINYIIKT